MTKQEFIRELARTREQGFMWQLEGTGGAIRATHKDTIRQDRHIIEYFTPITAVCYMQGKGNYYLAEDIEAGMELGMEKEAIKKLAHSADFSLSSWGTIDRRTMLDSVGIQE